MGNEVYDLAVYPGIFLAETFVTASRLLTVSLCVPSTERFWNISVFREK